MTTRSSFSFGAVISRKVIHLRIRWEASRAQRIASRGVEACAEFLHFVLEQSHLISRDGSKRLPQSTFVVNATAHTHHAHLNLPHRWDGYPRTISGADARLWQDRSHRHTRSTATLRVSALLMPRSPRCADDIGQQPHRCHDRRVPEFLLVAAGEFTEQQGVVVIPGA